MSTAPSNSLHQANLTGGYALRRSQNWRRISYGYNWQNDSYAPISILQVRGNTPNPYNMMQQNGLPASSLNGQVETIHGD